jgi:uncharacterized protein (TIGR02271 family)
LHNNQGRTNRYEHWEEYVAYNAKNYGNQLQSISELRNYTIESGDPDPRGWHVVTSDGNRAGVVEDLLVDTSAMKVRQLVVALDADTSAGGRNRVALNVDDVELREGRREVFARTVSGTPYYASGASAAQDHAGTDVDEGEGARLTRSEEELHIGKREVSRGEARVGKHVETERVSEPVTRRREEVVVERRPVEAGARADASISSDEVRIPLTEEELVVEKRPVVKEELVVGKRVVEERDVVETELRREEFDIDTSTDKGGRGRGRGNR